MAVSYHHMLTGLHHRLLTFILLLITAASHPSEAAAESYPVSGSSGATSTAGISYQACCIECRFKFAMKTNLLHDALLTPDIGIELSLAPRFSIAGEWIYAWWSNNRHHRFWRIRGGWVEPRLWLGNKSAQRTFTGHHIGIYGSLHTYDFEFGHTGYQSPELVYGAGVAYGYSLRIAPRLNIDFSMRLGYSGGKQIKYHPECGTYVCDSHRYYRYWGPTALEITLVWFPGSRTFNNPDR